jgi:membrane-bound lytic murein transglycosylase B
MTEPPSTSGAPPTTALSAISATVASEPVALAAQAVEYERVVRDRNAPADTRRIAGERQQLVYRTMARRDEWVDAFFAHIPDDVAPFAHNNLAAARAPLDPTLSKPVPRRDTVPAWSIREPLPADQLLAFYKKGEALTGIEWVYIAAINMVETRFGRIVGLSTSDALGPMQFLPTTWNGFCEGDPWNDHDAIVCAARYLKRRGGPADMHKAIQGYNPNDMYERMVTSYAANLRADPEVLIGYHAWQVFYPSTAGDIRLPIGYHNDKPASAAEYVAAHPADLA